MSEGSDVVGVGDVVEDVGGDVVVGVVSAGGVRISAWRPRRGPRMTGRCWPGVRGRGGEWAGVAGAPGREGGERGAKKRSRVVWGGGGGVLLRGLAQAVILGNLGAALAARLDNPFFALAKSVGVEGAFQRVEGVVAALWTFADLSMAGVLLFALRAMAAELLPEQRLFWMPWGAVLLGTAGALAGFSASGAAELWNCRLVPAGNLFLGFLLPAALWLLGRFTEGQKR